MLRVFVSAALVLSIALAAGFLFADLSDRPASASHAGGMDAMSIDMEPSASPANTSTSLGSREVAARINENDALDADEDLVDSLMIDITATNIPPSTSMLAFFTTLIYDPPLTSNLCVVAADVDFLLGSNPGSDVFNVSDPTPDCDGDFLVLGFDANVSGASGSGVLARLTIETQPGVQPGVFPLYLHPQNSGHVDLFTNGYLADRVDGAFVCIETDCVDLDQDGVLNEDDVCLQIPGIPENDGCPLPGPAAVGGIAGLLDASRDGPPPSEGGTSTAAHPWVALAAAIPVLAAGGWLTMRLVRARRRTD